MLSSLGTRQMTTLRNEPISSPRTPQPASRATVTVACVSVDGRDDGHVPTYSSQSVVLMMLANGESVLGVNVIAGFLISSTSPGDGAHWSAATTEPYAPLLDVCMLIWSPATNCPVALGEPA